MNSALSNFHVILVSPQGERNVGGVARAMGNFGFRNLRIVDPRCDLSSLEAKRMSMHGYPILESAQIFPTLHEAHADLNLTIALSAKEVTARYAQQNLFDLDLAPLRNEKVGLVFGREERGLELEEIRSCNWVVNIPTDLEMPSINLASAASITFAHFFRALESWRSEADEIIRPEKGQIDLFFQRFFALLDRVQFTNPQNPVQLADDIRALFNRADPDERDLRILFGILTNIETALKEKRSSELR